MSVINGKGRAAAAAPAAAVAGSVVVIPDDVLDCLVVVRVFTCSTLCTGNGSGNDDLAASG